MVIQSTKLYLRLILFKEEGDSSITLEMEIKIVKISTKINISSTHSPFDLSPPVQIL